MSLYDIATNISTGRLCVSCGSVRFKKRHPRYECVSCGKVYKYKESFNRIPLKEFPRKYYEGKIMEWLTNSGDLTHVIESSNSKDLKWYWHYRKLYDTVEKFGKQRYRQLTEKSNGAIMEDVVVLAMMYFKERRDVVEGYIRFWNDDQKKMFYDAYKDRLKGVVR